MAREGLEQHKRPSAASNLRLAVQDERSALQSQLQQIQQQISLGRATLASLRQVRVALQKRITSAISSRVHPATAEPSSSSAPAAAAPPPRPAHHLTLLPQASHNGSRRSAAAAVARRKPRPPATRDAALPRPIAAFAAHSSISYPDILDSARHKEPECLRILLEQFRLRKAWTMHRLPAQVCWFVQTQYEVSPGVALSYSTSLSSPECVAAMVLHYMASYLEFALFTALEDTCRAPPHLTLSLPAPLR